MIEVSPLVLNVYDLPTVENVCRQTLREILSFPSRFSLAHVTMDPGSSSLLHQHQHLSEIYYILSGEGILYCGEKGYTMREDTYLIIPPGTPHRLFSLERNSLEHLVLAVPPFNAEDVHLVETSPFTLHQYYDAPRAKDNFPVRGKDGALLYELLSSVDQEALGTEMAVGYLPPGKFALTHSHEGILEVYYVLSGEGWVRVGEGRRRIQKGSVVPIFPNRFHALENDSSSELKVLCISNPPYDEDDFIIK